MDKKINKLCQIVGLKEIRTEKDVEKIFDFIKNFKEKAKSTRKAQNDYFRVSRSRENLLHAQNLERNLDSEINRIDEIINPQPQQQVLIFVK